MISVIIASNRAEYFAAVEENISLTIGVAHEIVHITELDRGLAAAYNTGGRKATYETFCFVHDDVLFHTRDWGKKVLDHLQEPVTGVIGVMGGRYKSAYGLTWRDGANTMHRYQVKDGVEGGKVLLANPLHEQKSSVLCIDGAFLCCKKSLWESRPFDEKTFRGFHFYDADFCMQVVQRCKNFVVYDILIEHFSQGRMDRSFMESSLLFERKWEQCLPATADVLSKKETAALEGYSLAIKLQEMKRTNFDLRTRWQLIRAYFKKYINVYHLIRSSYFGIVK